MRKLTVLLGVVTIGLAVLAIRPAVPALAQHKLSGRLGSENHETVPHSTSRVRFAPAVVYSTLGSNPISIVTGDFNNDGIPDLIVLGNQAGDIDLALGNGDGTFQPFRGIGGGCGYSRYIADGDFKNDGNLDLAVRTDPNFCYGNLYVTYGTGMGTLSGSILLLPPGSPFPLQMIVADFNGDGNQDLAFTGGSGFVYLFLGKGDGTFQPLRRFTSGGAESYSIAVGDVNGDGKPDLIVTNVFTGQSKGNVSVLLGNGDGTFQLPIKIRAGFRPTQSALGDFNGDGKLDMAVANKGRVDLFLGNGDGTFARGAVLRSPLPYIQWIATADFHSDGKTDIAIVDLPYAKFPNAVVVFSGNGDGTFEPPVSFKVGEDPGQMVVGDFNRDGKPDIATVHYISRTVSVLINTTP
jgi:hypothetical protein